MNACIFETLLVLCWLSRSEKKTDLKSCGIEERNVTS